MPDTQQKPPFLSVTQIRKDELYVAFRRLLGTVGGVLEATDRQAADLHRHLDSLRRAYDAGEALLRPEPKSESPQEATVLYARSVEVGDQLFLWGEWLTVGTIATGPVRMGGPGPGRIEFSWSVGSTAHQPYRCGTDDVLPVILGPRHLPGDAPEVDL